MKETIEKLVGLEKAVAVDRGPFDLFALFSSEEEEEDRWDLVVSATWIGFESLSAIEYLIRRLRSRLTADEFSRISKIAPLDIFDPRVSEIQNARTTEHKLEPLSDYRFNGSTVEKIYLITCKPQIDKTLLRQVWKIIVRKWKSGDAGMIKSNTILEELVRSDVKVGDYALDRVFEYLLKAGCIQGAQIVDADADEIRKHGSLSIGWVDPHCRIPSSLRVSA
jgi:hypothetical protein